MCGHVCVMRVLISEDEEARDDRGENQERQYERVQREETRECERGDDGAAEQPEARARTDDGQTAHESFGDVRRVISARVPSERVARAAGRKHEREQCDAAKPSDGSASVCAAPEFLKQM